MTTTWLEVPTPDGDLATIHTAARELRSAASAVVEQRQRLHLATAQTLESWQGAAAGGFALQERVAEESLRIIGTSYVSAAGRMESYAAAWDRAQSDAARAHETITDAVGAYVRGAQGVLEGVVGAIQGFLSGAAGLVDAILPGDQSALIAFAQRLRGWSPPGGGPELRVVGGRTGPLDAPSSVLDQVRDAAGWGVSHLLDGAGWVMNLVGDAVAWALGALKQLEEVFAAAVTAALAVAYRAINALIALGMKVAGAVANLARDILTAVWRATVQAIETVVDGAFDLAGAIADGARALAAAAWELVKKGAGIAALGLMLLLRSRPGADRRRLGEAGGRLDKKVWRLLHGNRELWDLYGKYRDAAGKDVYCDRATDALPDGWERLTDAELRRHGIDPALLHGDAGFDAVIYRTPRGIVVAFRGSEPPTDGNGVMDWSSDLVNGVGLTSKQGAQAVRLAQLTAAGFGNDVTFTGHSLGGGLAAMASIATGRPAVTFNAAGIGDGNYAYAVAAHGPGASEEQIINFHTPNDALTMFQEGAAITPAAGAQVTVASNGTDPVGHSTDSYDWPYASTSERVGQP